MGLFDSLWNSTVGKISEFATDGLFDLFGFGKQDIADRAQEHALKMQNAYNKDFAQFQSDLQLQSSKDLSAFQNQQALDFARSATSAQVQGMKQAGLNTAMLGGQVSAPSVSSSQVSTPMSGASPTAVFSGVADLMNAQTQQSLANAEIGKINAETEQTVIDNDTRDLMNRTNINEAQARTAVSIAEAMVKRTQSRFDLETYQNRLVATGLFNKKTSAEIGKAITDMGLTTEQRRTEKKEQESIEATIALTHRQRKAIDENLRVEWFNAISNRKAVNAQVVLSKSQVRLNEQQRGQIRSEQRYIDKQSQTEQEAYNRMIHEVSLAEAQSEKERVVADFAKEHPWIYNCSHLVASVLGVAILAMSKGRAPEVKGKTDIITHAPRKGNIIMPDGSVY